MQESDKQVRCQVIKDMAAGIVAIGLIVFICYIIGSTNWRAM